LDVVAHVYRFVSTDVPNNVELLLTRLVQHLVALI
jgi:hypothetical protein